MNQQELDKFKLYLAHITKKLKNNLSDDSKSNVELLEISYALQIASNIQSKFNKIINDKDDVND